jgi:hypothetical protein
MGVVLDAAAESLGVRAPGPLGARVLAATWEPPAAAWARAGFEDSLAVVGWKEEGDSLTLRVGSDGLPSTVELSHARGDRVEARYRGWDFVEGVRWPAWMEFEDRAAGLTLTLKLGHLVRNVAPARDRLVVRVPPDAERLEWPEVRRALERTRGL